MSVILISVLGPPRLICGTNNVEDINPYDWWNTTTPQEYPGYICNRIKHLNGDTFLAIVHDAASTGYVLITHDQGHNWSVAYRFYSDQPITLEVGNGYAFISGGSGIYRSIDGYNWTLLSGSPGSTQNFAVFPGGYIMAHKGDKLYRSYNNGDNWQQIYSPTRGSPIPWFDTLAASGSPSFAIAGKSHNYVIASLGASLWLTTNFGNSWTKIIEWSTWYIPRELHFTRGNTFILKIRKIGGDEVNSIMVSQDNCHSFVEKFNQDVTWEHQIEYIAPLDLILVGHTRYMEPYPPGTWLDRFTPALMYSKNNGISFTEVVSSTFGKTFSIIAICGWVHEPSTYEMDIILKKQRSKNLNMGITLKTIPTKAYTANIHIRKLRTNTLDMNMLLSKTVAKSYKPNIRVEKRDIEISCSFDLLIADRKQKTYSMSSIFKKIEHSYYRMSCLKRKTVSQDYGMGINLVGDYRLPLKRDVMLAFPQAFSLEIENINYVLRQDITKQRIDEHGY